MKNYEGTISLELALGLDDEWRESLAQVINDGREIGVFRRGQRYILRRAISETSKCYYIIRMRTGSLPEPTPEEMLVEGWVVVDGSAVGIEICDSCHVWREKGYMTVIVYDTSTADFILKLSAKTTSRYFRCCSATAVEISPDAALAFGVDAEEYIAL